MPCPERKQNRLKYDYRDNGAYFITICTQNRRNMLWFNTENTDHKPCLSNLRVIIDSAINKIPLIYKNINIDKYIIMPNHVHMILTITNFVGGRPVDAPTVSRIINQFKGTITKKNGHPPVWQKSFYEHIIRDENEYLAVWKYIDGNPLKWYDDEYYGQ